MTLFWGRICNHFCKGTKWLHPAQPRQAVLLRTTLGHGWREAVPMRLASTLAGILAEILRAKLSAETNKQPCQMHLGLCRALAKEAFGQSDQPPQQGPNSDNWPVLHPNLPSRVCCRSVFWCLLMSKLQIQQILCSFRFYSSETPP